MFSSYYYYFFLVMILGEMLKWISQPPLMSLFRAPLPTPSEIEAEKENYWEKHFSEFGRGVTMYRTTDLAKLVLSGIPDRLRREVWLIFSG
jgi:hypothetical protein